MDQRGANAFAAYLWTTEIHEISKHNGRNGKKKKEDTWIAAHNNMMAFSGKSQHDTWLGQKRYETANNYNIEQALNQQAWQWLFTDSST